MIYVDLYVFLWTTGGLGRIETSANKRNLLKKVLNAEPEL